ncbi:MAG: hypothetical protein ABIO17_11290 [Pseudoxanthomonas sp.]
MPRNFLTLGLLLLCVGALAACAAPPTSSSVNGSTQQPAVPAASTPPPQSLPPMSAPQPPKLASDVVAVITTCKTDADCVVKDVGSCCGAMPACVNKDSPTNPAAVQAQCQSKGMMGVCGFRELTACQCSSGQCVSAGPANPTPSSDPAEPVR